MNGKEITIPEGCVLQFEGGSLSNGVINCNIVQANLNYIFRNVIVNKLSKVNAEWFGVSTENEDNSTFLQLAATTTNNIYLYRTIYISNGIYKFTNSIDLSYINLIGCSPVQKLNDRIENSYKTIFQFNSNINIDFINITTIPSSSYKHNVTTIKNIIFYGNLKQFINSSCICTKGANSLLMEDCVIQYFDIALKLCYMISSKFNKIDIGNNNIGIKFYKYGGISTSTSFINSYIYENKYHFNNEENSVLDCKFINCIFESSKISSFIINPLGFNFLGLYNCYSENNNYSDNKNNSEIEILSETNYTSFILYSAGNFWSGSNAIEKEVDFIKIQNGCFYSIGDRFTRYKNVMNINDSKCGNNIISIIFNSYISSGSINTLSQDSIYGNNTRLSIDTYAENKRTLLKLSEKIDLRILPNNYPKNGISGDKSIDEQQSAVALSSNKAKALLYSNNVFAIGKKIRIGTADNCISLPVRDGNLNIVGANGNQSFIYLKKEKTGNTSLNIMSCDDFVSDYSNMWYNRIIPTIKETTDIPENIPIGNIVFSHNESKFYYRNLYNNKIVDMNGYRAAKSRGNTIDRPNSLTSEDIGFPFFDITLMKPIWWDGKKWMNFENNPVDSIKIGTTQQRPTRVKAGFYYFDTTLNKPIWKKEDTGTIWVDATGAEV